MSLPGWLNTSQLGPMKNTNRISPSNASTALRDRVVEAGGITILPRHELLSLIDRVRFRVSPKGEGVVARKLQRLLGAAGLGALPIGEERETVACREAHLHESGLFGHWDGLKRNSSMTLFDKRSDLGRVLMLAGNPGVDYQAIAEGLEPSFGLDRFETSADLRERASANGGFLVVSAQALCDAVWKFDDRPESVAKGLLTAGLLPLPLKRVDQLVVTDVELLLSLRPNQRVGVCLRTSSDPAAIILLCLVLAVHFPAEDAANLVRSLSLLFPGVQNPWLRLDSDGSR